MPGEINMTAIAFVLAAPFAGSFLGVVAIRLPAERPFLFARSVCDSCGHQLGPPDLIPIASFVFSHGRCRYCAASVSLLHPAMELGALVVALWAAVMTSGWILAASCLFGWTLLLLAAIDWRTGLLPDVLTLPLIVTGLTVAYAIDPASLADHVIGAVAGFAIFALLAAAYRRFRGRDGLGLGDAKLLAAAGAWLSWTGLPTTVLFAALAGLLVGACVFCLGQTDQIGRQAFLRPGARSGRLDRLALRSAGAGMINSTPIRDRGAPHRR